MRTGFVVVGCGGNAYALHSYLRVILHKLRLMEKVEPPVALVDGDNIEAGNWTRQHPGIRNGTPKTRSLGNLLASNRIIEFPQMLGDGKKGTVQLATVLKAPALGECDRLMVLCLPDNHPCRRLTVAQCRKIAAKDKRRIVLYVAGCDLARGTFVPGLWEKGQELIDPVALDSQLDPKRKDVPKPKEAGGCAMNDQNARSNFLTAMMLGAALDTVVESDPDNTRYRMGGWEMPEADFGRLNMFTVMV